MKTYLNLLFASLLCIAVACDQQGASNDETKEPAEEVNEDYERLRVEEDDASFLVDAYSYNSMIVRYGQEAMQKASTPAMQDFASQSVEYHQSLNNEIETLASERNVALPAVVGEDVEERAREMREKEGRDFDEAYLNVLESIQDNMIGNYEDAAEGADDEEIRNWASRTLPDIRAHEQTVETLDERIEN